jgi:hypothetical protein
VSVCVRERDLVDMSSNRMHAPFYQRREKKIEKRERERERHSE